MSDKRKDELLPCPFCGSVKSLQIIYAQSNEKVGAATNVLCNMNLGGCGAQCGFDPRNTSDGALTNWNTRSTQDDAIREAVEELCDKAEAASTAMYNRRGSSMAEYRLPLDHARSKVRAFISKHGGEG